MSNLGKQLGRLSDPEIRKQVHEARRQKIKAKKEQDEIIAEGIRQAKIGQAEEVTALLDILFTIAKDTAHPRHEWAIETLIKQGAFKKVEKKAEGSGNKEDISLDDAFAVIKAKKDELNS